MTPLPEARPGDAPAGMLARHNRSAMADAFLSLAQTQRRLSHRYRREAEAAELGGDYRRYAYCNTEARRLWRDAKWHLGQARSFT